MLRKGREGAKFHAIGGPGIFTAVLHHFNLAKKGKPFVYFYPIAPGNWHSVFNGTFANGIELYTNTHCIHLWNELLRREGEGIDKNATFDEESLIEQLKKRHGIKPLSDAPRITSTQLFHMINATDKYKISPNSNSKT